MNEALPFEHTQLAELADWATQLADFTFGEYGDGLGRLDWRKWRGDLDGRLASVGSPGEREQRDWSASSGVARGPIRRVSAAWLRFERLPWRCCGAADGPARRGGGALTKVGIVVGGARRGCAGGAGARSDGLRHGT
jgi:hypothetical protein